MFGDNYGGNNGCWRLLGIVEVMDVRELGIVKVMDVREVIIADIMDVWDCGKMDIVIDDD
ncbi:hypothetical protein Glove_16g78 [Diversispora epigaea]|uniref:Uncharacterized protein n=1 Tax=Diversispora epigaea TaxID=1348612 RepID=A0A397JMV6_9GLOM|nr:hypothetical protein Glove_16g78 [Diversispora epigaea]